MTIDIAPTKYFTFAEAAKVLPSRPHLSTWQRWRTRGVHGVQLTTVKIGGRRMVSADDLQRFIEAVTCAADRLPQPIRTSRQRERAILAAEAEIAHDGIGLRSAK